MQEHEIQREIKRQIIEGLQLSWTAYTMVEKQLIFLNSYKQESKATLDLYKQEFEDGSRTLIDLLTAQDDYISSRSKLLTATYDLLFAKFRVLDAMGEMVNTLFSQDAQKYYKPINANYNQISDPEALQLKDRDNDNVSDEIDLCDNTKLGFKVDMFGCAQENQEIINVIPITNNIPLHEDNSSLSDDGFLINLATFSSKDEVDKFIKSAKLENNSTVIEYLTPINKKRLFKIVSGVYQTRNKAAIALSQLPKVVKVNSPYINSVRNVKNLYVNYN
jgi:outer membrane protein, adhesin transport system